MNTPKLNPQQASQVIVAILQDVSAGLSPSQFRSFFCGAIAANVVGNMTDEYWREFSKIEICDNPGCNCCEIQEKFVAMLDVLRDDHHKHLAEGNP